MKNQHPDVTICSRILESNDGDRLETWIYILYLADQALSSNEFQTAEELSRFALQFSEEYMTLEAVGCSLRYLVDAFRRQGRITEAKTALARADKIFAQTALF
jgi:hypothetical protein